MTVIGSEYRVLDDGFIRVVDVMGADDAIVQAARISYGKGTKQVSEDRSLIRYLMRHRHSTPFEMCEIKFHLRVPMDCWRQWIRHRTASVNEYSTRYSEAIDACHKTAPGEWRNQSTGNRQGGEGRVEAAIGEALSREEIELHAYARRVYQGRLDAGVAREQARKDLPLSTYTEAYWKIDLHNLLHFLSLRMDSHAQYEIREYANIIGREIVANWCPLTWEAFVDYRLDGMSLSRLDKEVIHAITCGSGEEAMALAASLGWLERDSEGLRRSRERSEFEEKAARLGITVPWAKWSVTSG